VNPAKLPARYENEPYLALAKGMPCVACGADDGTIVAAHSNLQEHGRGSFRRADDYAVMWLCGRCHYDLDYGTTMNREEKYEFTLRMIVRSFGLAMERGRIAVVDGEYRRIAEAGEAPRKISAYDHAAAGGKIERLK
jgi:ribosomal protein S27AE